MTPDPAVLAKLDQAVIDAMRALAITRQSDPQDPAAVDQARQDLLAARTARGYASA